MNPDANGTNPALEYAHLSDDELRAMPTIDDGHFGNWKIDTGTFRVLVMRVGPEDGYHGPQIVREILVRGAWQTCDRLGIPQNSR